MESLIEWAAQYSAPILVLLCIGAAMIYVLKLVTERTLEAKFSQMRKYIELSLERRSGFEQQVLLERYQIIGDMLARLSRITTDLNRRRMGQHVQGLIHERDVVPLTAVFEDLHAKSHQLSRAAHGLLYEQAQTVLMLANVSSDDEFNSFTAQYQQNHSRLMELINEEFGTTAIKW